MSTVVIIGGGGGGGKSPTLAVQDDGTVLDANGTTVAHFVSVAAAIAYLQNLEAAGLSAAAPE
jgi:Tfp pilus assembly ATPase PilU